MSQLPAATRRLTSLVLVRLAYVALVATISAGQPGWDLTASYIAGGLVASGQFSAIYDQADGLSARQTSSAWPAAARQAGVDPGLLTAYIQTPLWAWIISPLAAHLSFTAFKILFAILSAAAVVALAGVSADLWAPSLSGPAWQAGLLFGSLLTTPFVSAMALGQVQAIFLCLAVAAAAAALRGRPLLAGALLAGAASVKITPGWLALAWLAAGRHRAAAAFAGTMALLTAASVLISGPAVFTAYVHTLVTLGHTATLSYNNDSLAAVLLGARLTPDAAFRFAPIPMPIWATALSLLALSASAIYAGLADRKVGAGHQTGAIFALVSATAFSPLAWNHYFIVLLLPAMLFLAQPRHRLAWAALTALIVALNMPPLGYAIGGSLGAVARRTPFWAAVLCLVVMGRQGKQSFFEKKDQKTFAPV